VPRFQYFPLRLGCFTDSGLQMPLIGTSLRRVRRRSVSIAVASASLCTAVAVAQTTLTWGGSLSGIIENPANWLENTITADPVNVVFGLGPGGASQTILISDDRPLLDVLFTNTLRPAYTLAAGSGASPVLRLQGNVTVEAGAPVVVGTGLTVALVPGLHEFDIASGTSLTLLQGIEQTTGAASINKLGGGLLALGGFGTFSGGLTVSAGELRLIAPAVSDPSSRGPVGTGTLRLADGTLLTSEGSGSGMSLFNSIELLGDVRIGRDGHKLTLAGALSGAGSLEVAGDLTLTHANNSYTGDTKVTAGTLTLGALNALPTGTSLELGANTSLAVSFSQTLEQLWGDVLSQISLAPGATLKVDFGNDLESVFSGAISGSGALQVADSGFGRGLILDGSASHTGGTTIDSAATLQIGNGGTTGSIAGAIANQGTLTIDRSNAASALTVAGAISGTGRVVNTSGFTMLAGSNTYSGGTTVAGGVLAASVNGAFGTGAITVQSGGALGALSGAVVTNALTLQSGSTLFGHGAFHTASVGNNVTLAPGPQRSTVGTLQFNDLTLGPGGVYEWNLLSPTTYDQVLMAASSSLHIAATVENPFVLRLVSLEADGSAGTATGFSNTAYTWTLINASAAALDGFDSAKFSIEASAFLTNVGPGDFAFVNVGGQLQLTFTPVPEPSTYVLMATGLGAMGLAAWRRRRQRQRE
jgi:fibronectin-binding autotransporter adhesin